MGKLILLRHGESVWNLLNIFTGWVDVPLSQKGIDQAKEAGRKLRGLPLDACFTSLLIRAEMTLFLALAETESPKIPYIVQEEKKWGTYIDETTQKSLLPVYRSSALNERMYGELQGKHKEAMRHLYGKEQVELWRRSYDIAPPGGESLKMTKERTLPYFNEHILPLLKNEKNVLVVAHGNSLRSILMHLESLTETQIVSLEIPLGEPLFYELC